MVRHAGTIYLPLGIWVCSWYLAWYKEMWLVCFTHLWWHFIRENKSDWIMFITCPITFAPVLMGNPGTLNCCLFLARHLVSMGNLMTQNDVWYKYTIHFLIKCDYFAVLWIEIFAVMMSKSNLDSRLNLFDFLFYSFSTFLQDLYSHVPNTPVNLVLRYSL